MDAERAIWNETAPSATTFPLQLKDQAVGIDILNDGHTNNRQGGKGANSCMEDTPRGWKKGNRSLQNHQQTPRPRERLNVVEAWEQRKRPPPQESELLPAAAG
jgi:hypothetical protein